MTKHYSFTREGVRTYLDDILEDIMESIHETGTFSNDLYITVGSRTIAIPMVAETYEAIDGALLDSVDIWETEYKEGENDNENE